MAVRIPTRLRLIAVAVGALLMLVIRTGNSQVVPTSEVKATVFDESGAVVPNCEIVFRSGSEAIVSRTGPDGSLAVTLRNGRYAVQTSKVGFVKSDIQFSAPISDPLRIVLQVDHTSMVDGVGSLNEIHTTGSELPNVVEPERGQPAVGQPITKSRSWQCLYLWKCSRS